MSEQISSNSYSTQINKELLALIEGIAITDPTGLVQYTNAEDILNDNNEYTEVYIHLKCVPNNKYKLDSYHVGRTSLMEAKLYLLAGIPLLPLTANS